MFGLTVPDTRLDRVLASASATLDDCWWFLGGHGMSFPSIQAPKRLENGQYDPVEWRRYMKATSRAGDEYGKWLEITPANDRIGKPGFFSRYAAGMDSNWAMFFVSDAAELPVFSLKTAAERFNGVFFEPPPTDLPQDICLITRDIDSGHLDLFFRDEWLFKQLWFDLENKGRRPRTYTPLQPEEKR